MAEVNRPVFSKLPTPLKEICRYISFSSLEEKIKEIASVTKFLKPEFLEDFAESCDVEDINWSEKLETQVSDKFKKHMDSTKQDIQISSRT